MQRYTPPVAEVVVDAAAAADKENTAAAGAGDIAVAAAAVDYDVGVVVDVDVVGSEDRSIAHEGSRIVGEKERDLLATSY